MRICVVNQNLAVCDYNDLVSNRVIIWVMKEYGVKESWSKDFVITDMIYKDRLEIYEPILINGNGQIFMIHNNYSVMLYDPKSEALGSKRHIFKVSSDFRAIAHVPSLISLKDFAKGEILKVLR